LVQYNFVTLMRLQVDTWCFADAVGTHGHKTHIKCFLKEGFIAVAVINTYKCFDNFTGFLEAQRRLGKSGLG